ncbi:MAG: hypothetical protein GVY24_06455 [Planctomycetes bacterium]|jgi:hypothetical protein|nr:hypothetical protein [Planctomycetota bacterium]
MIVIQAFWQTRAKMLDSWNRDGAAEQAFSPMNAFVLLVQAVEGRPDKHRLARRSAR